MLGGLDLRGNEHVLDIGCGRGAVLISAARQLPRVRATGADIWRLRDQTGNSRAAAERNAMGRDVSERVEFADADARDLPFLPESFDVVLSNLTFCPWRLKSHGWMAGGAQECYRWYCIRASPLARGP